MIHVVSTGFAAPTRERCILSVEGQTCPHRHHYIEASEQSRPLSGYENAWNVIKTLAPEDIVAMVDGDDWLIGSDALAVVQSRHDAGAWVTYGSFEYSDGRPGFAALWQGRQGPWTATHLKTFRAGLFQRIDHGGDFHEHAWDIRVMVPMLEMAAERAVFVPEVLYVYNFASSYEHQASGVELAQLRGAADRVRDGRPYERLESL